MERVKKMTAVDSPKTAFIGASNGDKPEYYAIFQAAMKSAQISNIRRILASFSEEDHSFLTNADLIVLSGGSVKIGWQVFDTVGIRGIIIERHKKGAVLLGISAGAIQLGQVGWQQTHSETLKIFPTFQLVPYIIGAHEEADEWRTLKDVLSQSGSSSAALGIPFGAGLICKEDGSIEPIHLPVIKFTKIGDGLQRVVLQPPPRS